MGRPAAPLLCSSGWPVLPRFCPTGRGDVLFPDGSSYSGSFRDGKRDGRGDYTFSAGQHLSGRWIMDELDKGGVWGGRADRPRLSGALDFSLGCSFRTAAPGTLLIQRTFEIDADRWAFPIALGNDIARIHQRAGFDHRGD